MPQQFQLPARRLASGYELVTRAHELGYRALALTDECSLAGVVRAYEAARALPAESRCRLIVGAEFRAAMDPQLVLLAPDQRAYARDLPADHPGATSCRQGPL